MNQENEIMEITNPPVSQHPAELILAGIKEKLNTFESEHQQLVRQLQSKLKEIDHLKSEIQKQGLTLHQAYLEKKVWLTQLVAYWQREVDLLTLANQIQGDISPQQKQELLTRMNQLNQTNVKFANTYQPKSSWVKKVFYLLIVLLVCGLGAYGLNSKYHWLKF